jgi:hypothetical protein
MAIASWPSRTIVWLWVGLLSCYALLIGVSAVQNHRRRQTFERAMDLVPVPVQTTGIASSSAALARRDSLLDSLKRIGQAYLASRDGQATVKSIGTALTLASRDATKAFLLALALFLAPTVLLVAITFRWLSHRRRAFGRAGA